MCENANLCTVFSVFNAACLALLAPTQIPVEYPRDEHSKAYRVEQPLHLNTALGKHSQLPYSLPLHNAKPLTLRKQTIFIAPRLQVGEG